MLQFGQGPLDCGQALLRHEIGVGRDRAVGKGLDPAAVVFLDERPAHISPRLRMAPRCSLMRNTISTNSATIRANRMPIVTPSRLPSSMKKPTPALVVIICSAEAMPDRPNRMMMATASQKNSLMIEGVTKRSY